MRRTDRKRKWIAIGLAVSLLAGCPGSMAADIEMETAPETQMQSDTEQIADTKKADAEQTSATSGTESTADAGQTSGTKSTGTGMENAAGTDTEGTADTEQPSGTAGAGTDTEGTADAVQSSGTADVDTDTEGTADTVQSPGTADVGTDTEGTADTTQSSETADTGTDTGSTANTEQAPGTTDEADAGTENTADAEQPSGIEGSDADTESTADMEQSPATEDTGTSTESTANPGNPSASEYPDADTENTANTEQTPVTENTSDSEGETNTGTETNTENAEAVSEVQTELTGNDPDSSMLVLEGQGRNVTVRASRSDREPFPDGAFVTVTSLEELAQEAEDPSAELAQYRKILTDAAIESLAAEYMVLHPEMEWDGELEDALQTSLLDSAGTLHAYEVSVWHEDESCFDASLLDLLFQISDSEMKRRMENGSVSVRVIAFTDALGAVLPTLEQCTSGTASQEEKAYFSVEGAEQGIFAALELDADWQFDAKLETGVTEAGEDFADEETGLYAIPENAYTQIGTNMASSGIFTPVNYGDRFYSNSYTSLCKTGASEISAWNNGGANVKVFELINSGGNPYTAMVPLNGNAQGAFGWRISNVGFSRAYGCRLDAVVTVEAYSTSTTSYKGTKVENVYPVIAISPGGNVVYNQSLPAFRLRYDIVQNGTSTPVPGNYRFCWLDIDAGQQYGFTAANGTIDGRYCMATTAVNTDIQQYSDGLQYTRMIAPVDTNATRDPNFQAYFEVGNTSCFKLWVGPAYRDYDGTTGYTKKHVEDVYSNVVNKNWDYASKSIIEWDGTSPGPVGGEPVEKFVSNDGVTWQKENTLGRTDDEFWYMLRTRVPEMYGYQFAAYSLNDVLPAGVDYAGSFSAMRMETGTDATIFFSESTTSEDNVSFSWNGVSGFGGYTYQLRFKVRMDPSEMTPAYAGDTRTYSVSNRASLFYQIAGYDVLTYQSDSVTTSAQEKRTEPPAPSKRIRDGNSFVNEKEYNNRLFETVFSVEQEIPAYGGSWRFRSFSLTDTLEECFTLQSASLYLEGSQTASFQNATNGAKSGGWTLLVNGQTVTMTAAEGLSDEYYGKTLRLELKVKLKAGNDTALEKYYSADNGTIRAVIPNKAAVSCTWPDGVSCTKETNTVTIFVKEAMADLTVTKKNNATGDPVANAVFAVYQWKNNSWSRFCGMTYDAGTKRYKAERYLYKTAGNSGRFRVQEDRTPSGYSGAWSKEFTLGGRDGELISVSFQAVNEMAVGKITIKKTAKDKTVLAGAVYAITAGANIVSPEGRVLVKAGEEVARVTTGADGMATASKLYPGTYQITELQPPSGYSLNKTPQTVTIRYLDKNSGCSSENVTFTNEKTLVILKKVSALSGKETEKRTLPGVAFRVWEKQTKAGAEAQEYKTDDKGQIRLEGYRPGTYCYQEVSAPDGYVTDSRIYEFKIDNSGFCANEPGHVIEIENQYIKADFRKTDKATGKLLKGAKLSLIAQDGTVVDTWVTDDNPHRIDRLPAGSYTLTELEAPDGYKKGTDVTCNVKAVSSTQTFTITDVKYVSLRLTKAVSGEEIVWAHGNPTFTFCVEGTDLDGDEHKFYETVEFTREAVSGSGRNTMTAVFRLPAGNYSASERNVIRYRLDAIEAISNGQAAGAGVRFDLSDNQDGAATFVNRKETDQGLTDTAFVRNTIIGQK